MKIIDALLMSNKEAGNGNDVTVETYKIDISETIQSYNGLTLISGYIVDVIGKNIAPDRFIGVTMKTDGYEPYANYIMIGCDYEIMGTQQKVVIQVQAYNGAGWDYTITSVTLKIIYKN